MVLAILLIIIFIPLFITLFITLCFHFYNKFKLKTKENLTLPSYSSIYIDKIQTSLTSLTSDSVTACNNLQSDVGVIQTNVATAIRPINPTNTNITNSENTITSEMNDVNTVPTSQTSISIGSSSYSNSTASKLVVNLGIIQTTTLASINIKGLVSTITTNTSPYIQFILKPNNNAYYWASDLTRIPKIFDKKITQGISNSYTVKIPIIIPTSTTLYMVLSPNSYINTVSTTLIYQPNSGTTSSYDLTTSVNTSVINQSGVTNQFTYNTNATYGINNNNQKSSKISPSSSVLNVSMIPNVTIQNNLYNNATSAYNSANTQLAAFIANINTIKTDLSTLKTHLASMVAIQTNLNNILTSINNELNISRTSQITAERSVTNTNNYSDAVAIQKALGSVYTNAKTNVDNALISKNNAETALQDGINNKVSASEIDRLTTNRNNAVESYTQAYEIMRFLLDPSNLVNDISNTSDVITLNANLNTGQIMDTFLDYFVNNNIDIKNSKIFLNLSNNVNKSMTNITDTTTKITNVFQEVVSVVKNNAITTATNSLNKCKSADTTLNGLLKTVNDNITIVTNIINNTNAYIANVNTFLTTTDRMIVNYNLMLVEIYARIVTVSKYKVEYFYHSNTINNWRYNKVLVSIGKIINTGTLVKLYFFANIYSWATCIEGYTYFKVVITDANKSEVYSTGLFYISYSPDMTLEFLSPVLNARVMPGYDVNILIAGGSYYCSVDSNNAQVKLDIVTS